MLEVIVRRLLVFAATAAILGPGVASAYTCDEDEITRQAGACIQSNGLSNAALCRQRALAGCGTAEPYEPPAAKAKQADCPPGYHWVIPGYGLPRECQPYGPGTPPVGRGPNRSTISR